MWNTIYKIYPSSFYKPSITPTAQSGMTLKEVKWMGATSFKHRKGKQNLLSPFY